MTLQLWIIVGVSILVVAILIEAYVKRGRRSKPMHEKFGAEKATKPPLGMEATDIEGFNQANQLNNDLARYNGAPPLRNTVRKVPRARKRTPEDHAKIFIPKQKNHE